MCGKISRYVSLLFFILFSQYLFAATANDSVTQQAESSNADLTLCPIKDNAATKHIKPRAFSIENSGNTEISADFTESSTDG